MSKITNTKEQFRENPGIGLAFIHLGDGAVEAQEARGQRELVNAAVLPTRGLNGGPNAADRAAWDGMGIKIGKPVNGDDMFTNVELPAGWCKRPTDHSMWSDLVDNKGRVRGRIFYKAAFYDRSAYITAVRRFDVGRDYDRKDYRSVVVMRVTDCGQVVFASDPVAIDPKDRDASDRAEKAGREVCTKWLADHGYGDYGNAVAYWG